jgi:hypothetical protein
MPPLRPPSRRVECVATLQRSEILHLTETPLQAENLQMIETLLQLKTLPQSGSNACEEDRREGHEGEFAECVKRCLEAIARDQPARKAQFISLLCSSLQTKQISAATSEVNSYTPLGPGPVCMNVR